MSAATRPQAGGRLVWSASSAFGAILLAGGILVTACGEEEVERGVPERPSAEKAPAKAKQAKAPAEPAVPIEPGAPMKGRELPDDAFIETDENRDPFRPYLAVVGIASANIGETEPRPEVLLSSHLLDNLRLIAIVSGAEGNPRAMLVDPDGKGWVVRRGDYVGRGERISLGPGQPDREINWRVVRVRPDRLIFVREDPSGLGNPITRVLRLYPEEDSS